MKSILITGGLGNLGSWLTSHFVEKNFEVTVLAKNLRPILQNLSFKYIACDISSFQSCQTKINPEDFDYVIHAASVNDGFVDNYFQNSLSVNTLGTRNILEVFKNSKRLTHFIYLSTFQVYGTYSGYIDESTKTEPKNDYGSTHLFAEYYVKQMGFSNKLPFSILRLTNSYGCPKDINSSKWYLVLNDLSKMAFENQKITLKSNGLAPRDFIWMGDVCEIIEKLSTNPATGEIFNLSAETSINMLEVAKFVQKAYQETFGKKITIETNKSDTSKFEESLMVNAKKLKKVVPYHANLHFVEEAKNIFNFIESHNLQLTQA